MGLEHSVYTFLIKIRQMCDNFMYTCTLITNIVLVIILTYCFIPSRPKNLSMLSAIESLEEKYPYFWMFVLNISTILATLQTWLFTSLSELFENFINRFIFKNAFLLMADTIRSFRNKSFFDQKSRSLFLEFIIEEIKTPRNTLNLAGENSYPFSAVASIM